VFLLGFIGAELARRRGRALVTALGLAVGIALVVAVTALSRGVEDAQQEVFGPLTGVGPDLLVSRPVDLGNGGGGLAAFAMLPRKEQQALQKENQDAFVDPADLGSPGDHFTADSFLPATQLTFPAAVGQALRTLPDVETVGRALTVLLVHAEGEVPQQSRSRARPTFRGGDITISTATVAGVEAGRRDLGLITPAQLTRGRFLAPDSKDREAVLAESYAARRGLRPGRTFTLDGKRIRVVGLARPPIGGQAADIYLDLPVLQRLADREQRVNLLLVRARKAADVTRLANRVERFAPGIVASSSADLARTVDGSIVGAGKLSDRLGLLLAIVALTAAVIVAALLVLAGVAKRTRELGSLRALGWTRTRVVALVLGESAAIGVIGAVLGIALGFAAAAAVAEVVPPLEASVASKISLGSLLGGGTGPAPRAEIPLHAPVDGSLLALAVALALGAALLAGAAGAVRAARLRPAEALRRLD
jgi:ABC-type antimicrobial peptide transport system permease subunit